MTDTFFLRVCIFDSQAQKKNQKIKMSTLEKLEMRKVCKGKCDRDSPLR